MSTMDVDPESSSSTTNSQTEEPQDVGVQLANLIFKMSNPSCNLSEKKSASGFVLSLTKERGLSRLYASVSSNAAFKELVPPLDAKLLKNMQDAEEVKMTELDAAIVDARENLGDTDVRAAVLAKALYVCEHGTREEADKALDEVDALTSATGQKMDLVFTRLKLALRYGDLTQVGKLLHDNTALFASGGDWERKNRLKVYEAVHKMAVRKFSDAAQLFLDAIATFTCTELLDFPTLVYYTVVTCVCALDRPTIKTRVMDSPEVRTVIGEQPSLQTLLSSFYECRYKELLTALCEVTDSLGRDVYLRPHAKYVFREVRVRAYAQFLTAYKSVTMSRMAEQFGVSDAFLDEELCTLIAADRVNARMDKAGGIVETTRPDVKSALFVKTVKEGDALLNRIQKLSKICDV